MGIKTNQILEEPRLLGGILTPPTTGSTKGVFFALDVGAGETEAAFADEAGNVTQITAAGALNLGSVSHNSLTDLTVGDAHTQYHNDSRGDIRYYQKSEHINASAGVGDAGKPVKLNAAGVIDASMVPGASGEANTASNLGAAQTADVFKAKVGVDLQFRRILQGANMTITENADSITFASTGGGGGLGSEFKVELGAGASIADKVAAATSIPGGWTIIESQNAAVDAELQSGGTTDDVVFIHETGLMAVIINVVRADPFGGFLSIDSTQSGAIKVSPDKNQARLKDFNTAVGNNASTVYLKLV
jgi:hypothetical protein